VAEKFNFAQKKYYLPENIIFAQKKLWRKNSLAEKIWRKKTHFSVRKYLFGRKI